MEPNEIQDSAKELQKLYSEDLEEIFGAECVHLKSFLLSSGDDMCYLSLAQLFQILRSKNCLDLYPNISIALKIYLSTRATNCSAERSFSVPGRINNYLRTSQTQERLNHLALLAIENDLTVQLDFENVISVFASTKAIRRSFS